MSKHLDNLEKKLKEIKTLVAEKPKSLDNLAMPKVGSGDSSKPAGIRAPKANEQASKKDPKKVADQLKNAGDKKQALNEIKTGADKLVKFNAHGQWHF